MSPHTPAPSVSAAELEQAHALPAVAFADAVHAEKPDQQDFIGAVPDVLMQPLPPHRDGERVGASLCRSPHAAVKALREMRDNGGYVGGVGLPWWHLRFHGWFVNPLWPSSEQAALHGAPVHRYDRFAAVPAGHTVVFLNGELGWSGLTLGGGLCDTTDYHVAGCSGVATMANVYDWSGATDWVAIEVVNGVDTWPNSREKPKTWTRHALAAQLREDADRAHDNGRTRRARGLRDWHQETGA